MSSADFSIHQYTYDSTDSAVTIRLQMLLPKGATLSVIRVVKRDCQVLNQFEGALSLYRQHNSPKRCNEVFPFSAIRELGVVNMLRVRDAPTAYSYIP